MQNGRVGGAARSRTVNTPAPFATSGTVRGVGETDEPDGAADRARVLIVDDEAGIRLLVADALAEEGFVTSIAESGDHALRLLATGDFDLVLLDRHMPGLDGLEVLHWIRQSPDIATLPVIMLTADDDPGASATGLDHGADDYVVKPFELDDLAARVRRRLRTVSFWSHAVDREIERRDAMAAAATGAATVELDEAARQLAEELLRLPEVAGVDFVEVCGGQLLPLATAGQGALDHLTDQPWSPAAGRALCARAERGAFRDAGSAPQTTEALPVAVAPIRFEDELVALLVATPAPGAPGILADRLLGVVVDFAALATGVLGRTVAESARRRAEVDRIHRILADHSFYTVFQPVFDLGSERAVGYEALTRFADGAPAATFAMAASGGVGVDLELETLHDASRSAHDLPDDGWLAVNISPHLLTGRDDLWEVFDGLDSRTLVLEVHEIDPLTDHEALHRSLASAPFPVRLAVDDSGSRFAGLAHVLALQADFLKIDRNWVAGVESDAEKRATVAGMRHFAEESRATLVAEGIETSAELEALRSLDVTLGQGDLLGSPRLLS